MEPDFWLFPSRRPTGFWVLVSDFWPALSPVLNLEVSFVFLGGWKSLEDDPVLLVESERPEAADKTAEAARFNSVTSTPDTCDKTAIHLPLSSSLFNTIGQSLSSLERTGAKQMNELVWREEIYSVRKSDLEAELCWVIWILC
jgi:hypothetical protein